ncbi:early estrogen-induced gene 1 protein-like [Stegostoma tigrinum]|uniref:early estrogen-induced gene 1 protein-like n=1 Tax=Stegostoma tigrinum TaxID=3053191 RepID=UPI0028703FDE|nr:early estrogen-induced gene 1 protein-like [Stegostoma tigrinum]
MAFLMKKKKFKFLVSLTLEELSAVPFVNGILFCKIRLLDGGSFSDLSSREEVQQNCVRWRKTSRFMCKMSASPVTGMLAPCTCRISVRKELKGGKAFIKLGFVDVNLAEFAGSGMTARCYILEGYDTKNTRQDNSILKISIVLQLLLGDPCFKTPSPHTALTSIAASEDPLQLGCKGDAATDGESLRPRRPNTLRLPKCRSLVIASGVGEDTDSAISTPDSATSVCQPLSSPSSINSQHSKVSGYSMEHSRGVSLSEPTRRRKLSSVSSGLSSGPSSAADIEGVARDLSFEKPPLPIWPSERHSRRRNRAPEKYPSWVNDTRVNADDIVESIIQTQDFTDYSDSEESGLQLFVARDGSTLVGGCQLTNRQAVNDYVPVVIGSH